MLVCMCACVRVSVQPRNETLDRVSVFVCGQEKEGRKLSNQGGSNDGNLQQKGWKKEQNAEGRVGFDDQSDCQQPRPSSAHHLSSTLQVWGGLEQSPSTHVPALNWQCRQKTIKGKENKFKKEKQQQQQC